MFLNFRPILLLHFGLCGAVILGMAGGCRTPEQFKLEADEEVYEVINDKWQEDFGQKVNYTVNDVPPSPDDVQIENAVPESGVITLTQAVAMATAHNREYQKQKEELYLEALDLTLERHNFARQWFGTFDAKYSKDSEDEKVSVNKDGTKLGFDQMLADGAQISASIALDWARFLTGDPRTSLGSVLSATITQPLLRGRGRKIAQEDLTQAEREVLYQIRSFNRFRKTFVVSIITDYYRVLQQKDAVTNAESNYKIKIKTRERLEMEAAEGRTGGFRVGQAQQDELNARDRYIREQQRYEQQLDEFKIRLSLPTDAKIELEQNELKGLEEIGISQPDYTLNTAIETALLQRLDLATSTDKVDDAARKIIVAADNLRAELNLVGSANVSSAEKTKIDRLQFNNGTYELGLEGDLPLDRKSERNVYRKALITLEQQQREYDNQRDKVKLDVRQAWRQLLEEADSYSTQKKRLKLTEKRVKISPLLWETQRAGTRDVLEAQDDLLEAQNRVTAALVNHAIAKLNFFRDVGILQVRPDGMWKQR